MEEDTDFVVNETSETRPHTILVPISLSKAYYRQHCDDPDFSLVDMMIEGVEKQLVELGKQETEIAALKNFSSDSETPEDKFSGDVETNKLVAALAILRHSENYAFRWFADTNRLSLGGSNDEVRDVFTILDNIDHFGWERDFGSEAPTSTTGDPKAWQGLGEPDRDTKSTYLLAFPAEGVIRKTSKRFGNEQLPGTYFEDGSPSMTERQKYLYAINWQV